VKLQKGYPTMTTWAEKLKPPELPEPTDQEIVDMIGVEGLEAVEAIS
jgi:hypothetical protein